MGEPPERMDPERMDLPPVVKHQATERFGKQALRTAYELGRALAEEDTSAVGPGDRSDDAAGPDDPTPPGAARPGVEPIVVTTRGPHRSLDGLAALIDDALADDERAAAAGPPSRSAGAGTDGGSPEG